MMGAIIGDIVGSRFENKVLIRISGVQFGTKFPLHFLLSLKIRPLLRDI